MTFEIQATEWGALCLSDLATYLCRAWWNFEPRIGGLAESKVGSCFTDHTYVWPRSRPVRLGYVIIIYNRLGYYASSKRTVDFITGWGVPEPCRWRKPVVAQDTYCGTLTPPPPDWPHIKRLRSIVINQMMYDDERTCVSDVVICRLAGWYKTKNTPKYAGRFQNTRYNIYAFQVKTIQYYQV